MNRTRIGWILFAVWVGVTLILAFYRMACMPDPGREVAEELAQSRATSEPVLLGLIPGTAGTAATQEQTEPSLVAVVWDDRGESGESKLSRSRARNVSRLLGRAGVPTSVFPVSALEKALSGPCRVAHLVLLHSLANSDLELLTEFSTTGGQLIVHGSRSVPLMRFFGLRPLQDDYTAARRGQVWEGYPLAGISEELSGIPDRLYNPAPMVLELEPASEAVRTLTRWEDSKGEKGPGALFVAPRGYWLSRVLYDDDTLGTRECFLTVLTAARTPAVWEECADALRARAWHRLGAKDIREAEQRMLRLAPENKRAAVRDGFQALRKQEEAWHQAKRGNHMRKAATLARKLLRDAERVYATAVFSGRQGLPTFAVWARADLAVQTPGGWPSIAEGLAKAGVTDLMLRAGSPARADTPLPSVTRSSALRRHGDPFPDAIRACHAHGIRVHAWFPVLEFHDATPLRRKLYEKAGRLLTDENGKAMAWLNPAHPDNVKELTELVRYLATKTDVDGINFDFLRYPEQPIQGEKNPEVLTALLRSLTAAANGKRVSAAVYGSYPRCIERVGQDWQVWLDEGLLQQALPMNYAADVPTLRWIMKQQTRNRGRLISGIGLISNEALMDAVELIDQLLEVGRQGYGGAALYYCDASFFEEYLPVLER